MATLLLFGAMADIAGVRKQDLEAKTLGELVEAASERFGERFSKALTHCTLAVDGLTLDHVDPSLELGPDSEVAVLPPVSGGSPEERIPIRMADVGSKPTTARQATACCRVVASQETLDAVESGTLPKGDALAAARLAGILGAKLTPQLVPLCHPVCISAVEVEISREGPDSLVVTVTVRGQDRTGFEMEAMVGACAAALTIYDMTKSLEPGMCVQDLRLLSKSGGKSGEWAASETGRGY